MADKDLKSNAKDLIDAADKYGIGNLKLEAEACFVSSTKITTNNILEHLFYADAKNLALLREALIDFHCQKCSRSYRRMFLRLANKDQLCTLRISDLRRKVHEKGLDVYGSRKTLIAALKETLGI